MSFDTRTRDAYNARKVRPSYQLFPLMDVVSPQRPRLENTADLSVFARWFPARGPAWRRLEVCMDSQLNQLARELTDAVSAAVSADAKVEACREKARAAGFDMRVSLEAVVGFAASRRKARAGPPGARPPRPARTRGCRDERQRPAVPEVPAHLSGRADREGSRVTPSCGRWPAWRPPRRPCGPRPGRPGSSSGSASADCPVRRPAEFPSECSTRRCPCRRFRPGV